MAFTAVNVSDQIAINGAAVVADAAAAAAAGVGAAAAGAAAGVGIGAAVAVADAGAAVEITASDGVQTLAEIVDDISVTILHNPEIDRKICFMYVCIGAFAGLVENINGNPVLEEKNYHQFPPALVHIYDTFPNSHFICIYIDPSLEQNPFVTTDPRMKSRFGDFYSYNQKSHHGNRISVFPFRKSIFVESTKYQQYHHDLCLNITPELEKLHQLAIEQNITMVYHNFTGHDDIKFIQQRFEPTITPHLDHIIYGLGCGNITGCYYDLTQPEAMFATKIVRGDVRPMISIFNIDEVVYNYLSIYGDKPDFPTFLQSIIETYDDDVSAAVIVAQINHYIATFIDIFRNNIMYLLRLAKNDEIKFLKGDKIIIDLNSYGFCHILSRDFARHISNLYKNPDENLFSSIVELIYDHYQIQFELLGYRKKMSGREFLSNIIADPDRYKWCNIFNHLIE